MNNQNSSTSPAADHSKAEPLRCDPQVCTSDLGDFWLECDVHGWHFDIHDIARAKGTSGIWGLIKLSDIIAAVETHSAEARA